MIYGVGTDIVEVARLAKMYERHGEDAVEKLLAPAERDDFAAVRDKGRYLAKRFAAKEAFAKALGTGVRAPVSLNDIAVTHDELGKPVLAYGGALAELIQARGLAAHLSLSDESAYAVAFVVLEQGS